MMKVLLKSSLLLALVTSLVFVSCEQESLETSADLVSVDNYVEASVVSLQDSAQCGRHGCFELVFPLSIEFPDGTTAEVNDREELKQAVRTWKEANPGVDGRPVLTFPITVEFEDGTTQTIETIEDLRTLKETCQETSDDEND